MLVNILITIVFFLILMYASVNLLGLLVRGLFTNPELDKLEKETEHEVEMFGGFLAREKTDQIPEQEKKEPEIAVKKEVKAQSSLFDF